VAKELRRNVDVASVRAVRVSFQGRGGADSGPGLVALRNVARLHGLIDCCGPVAEIVSIEHSPGELRLGLKLQSGAEVETHFKLGPDFGRRVLMKIESSGGVWVQANRELTYEGEAVTLAPRDRSLFLMDQRVAVERILGAGEHYVREDVVLGVLGVVDQVRAKSLR